MKDITQDPAAMQALQTLKNLGATAEEVQVALAALPAPKLHLFQDDEGQTYAARDLAHAKELWKADTGQDPEDTAWTSLDDTTMITAQVDENGEQRTKTAAEWASEYGVPGYCFGGSE